MFSRIFFQMDSFAENLYYSLKVQKEQMLDWNTTPKTEDLSSLSEIINMSPLRYDQLTEYDKLILKKCRKHYCTLPKKLNLFLQSIDWKNPLEVQEVKNMLNVWKSPSPEEALTLLDAEYSNEFVRLYAIEHISKMTDDNIVLYMIQFVEALKYENYHSSPLGEFLLERSL